MDAAVGAAAVAGRAAAIVSKRPWVARGDPLWRVNTASFERTNGRQHRGNRIPVYRA